MSIIEFETGQRVEFDGIPTQADIEEVARSLKLSKPAKPIDTRSTYKKTSDVIGDFSEGAVKGAISTAKNTAGALQKVGQKILAGIDPTQTYEQIRQNTGIKSIDSGTEQGRAVDQILTPRGTVQNIGYATERIAEFLVPSSKVAKVEQAATGLIKGGSRLSSASKLATRAGIEGATAATQTAIQEGNTDNIKTAAIIGAVFPVFGATAKTVKNSVAKGVEKTGQKIQQSVIKPSIRDVEDGFKIENLNKYKLGGSLNDTLTKTNIKMNELSEQIKQKLADSVIPVNLNDVFAKTESRITGNKLANFGENAGVKRALDALRQELEEVATPEGLVNLSDAQFIKRGAGTKGAWVFGNPDPDARAVEKVYSTFYNQIKTAIEEAAEKSGNGGIKELNKQLSELIPINNAALRRLPIEQRNNAISLTDSLSLFGTIFDPKGLALLGATRLSKSGKFGNLLVKAAENMKSRQSKTSVGKRIFGN